MSECVSSKNSEEIPRALGTLENERVENGEDEGGGVHGRTPLKTPPSLTLTLQYFVESQERQR